MATICGSLGPICGSVITVWLRLGLWLGVRVRIGVWVRVRIRVWVRVMDRVRVGDCCIQTAGESDKMRINHATETDQWRAALQIRPATPK